MPASMQDFLVNISFSTGVVPDILKIAKVVPIHKSDDNSLQANISPTIHIKNFRATDV